MPLAVVASKRSWVHGFPTAAWCGAVHFSKGKGRAVN
jgi:hypothetical protein